MCLSFCHRRSVLFHNHEDCPLICPHAWGPSGSCEDCVHRADELCGLTRSPLPDQDGCCHFDVELVVDPQTITEDRLFAVPIWMGETVEEILDAFGMAYRWGRNGTAIVDPGQFAVPDTYGVGTEPGEGG